MRWPQQAQTVTLNVVPNSVSLTGSIAQITVSQRQQRAASMQIILAIDTTMFALRLQLSVDWRMVAPIF